jgi:hypothetical protein
VEEYSISKVGPCEQTKQSLSIARDVGHKIMAKVQINNSWEIAVVPYIPVFDLIIEHMSNLKTLGVGGLMMSWTLGGYPTVSLDLVNRIFDDNFSYDEWLHDHFGENAAAVKSAVKSFSDGFKHYPHNIWTIYHAPHQMGAANLLYKEKTGYSATMVTFPFDDYKTWCGRYSKEEFVGLLTTILVNWQKGLDALKKLEGNEEFVKLKRYAEVVYVNFRSMLVQIEYNIAREGEDKQLIIQLLEEERELARRLYALAAQDACVGYEASNHYYFTQNHFLEKFINIEQLLEKFGK